MATQIPSLRILTGSNTSIKKLEPKTFPVNWKTQLGPVPPAYNSRASGGLGSLRLVQLAHPSNFQTSPSRGGHAGSSNSLKQTSPVPRSPGISNIVSLHPLLLEFKKASFRLLRHCTKFDTTGTVADPSTDDSVPPGTQEADDGVSLGLSKHIELTQLALRSVRNLMGHIYDRAQRTETSAEILKVSARKSVDAVRELAETPQDVNLLEKFVEVWGDLVRTVHSQVESYIKYGQVMTNQERSKIASRPRSLRSSKRLSASAATRHGKTSQPTSPNNVDDSGEKTDIQPPPNVPQSDHTNQESRNTSANLDPDATLRKAAQVSRPSAMSLSETLSNPTQYRGIEGSDNIKGNSHSLSREQEISKAKNEEDLQYIADVQYIAYLCSDQIEHKDVADAGTGASTIKPSGVKGYRGPESPESPKGTGALKRPNHLSDEGRFSSAVDMESGQQDSLQAAIRIYRRKIYPTRPSSPTRRRLSTRSVETQTTIKNISDVKATPLGQGAAQHIANKRGGDRKFVPWLLKKREKKSYIINISYPKTYIEARTRMGIPLDNNYSLPYPDVQHKPDNILGSSLPAKKIGLWTFNGWKKKAAEQQEAPEHENSGMSGWHPWAKIQKSASKESIKTDKADVSKMEKTPAYAEPPAPANVSSSASGDRRTRRISHKRPSNHTEQFAKGLNVLLPYMPARKDMPRRPIPFIPELPTTEDTEDENATTNGLQKNAAKRNVEIDSTKSGIKIDRDSLMEALRAAEIAAETAMRPNPPQRSSTTFGTDGAAPPDFCSTVAEKGERQNDETLARRRSRAVTRRISTNRNPTVISPTKDGFRTNRLSKLYTQKLAPTSLSMAPHYAGSFRERSSGFSLGTKSRRFRGLVVAGFSGSTRECTDAATSAGADPFAHRFRKCGGLAPLTSKGHPGRWGLLTCGGKREMVGSSKAKPKLKDLTTCVACDVGVWIFEKRFYCDDCGMTVHTSCLQDLNVFAHGCQDYAAFRTKGGQRHRSIPRFASFGRRSSSKIEQDGRAETAGSDVSDLLSFLDEGRASRRSSSTEAKSRNPLRAHGCMGSRSKLQVQTGPSLTDTSQLLNEGPSGEETSFEHSIPQMKPISPFLDPEIIFTKAATSVSPPTQHVQVNDSRTQKSVKESVRHSRTDNDQTLSRSTAAFIPAMINSDDVVTDVLTKPVQTFQPALPSFSQRQRHVVPLARCVSTSSFYGGNDGETPSINALVLLPDSGENLL